MKAVVAIKSMQDNPYFHSKATKLFDEVVYWESRPTQAEMPEFLSSGDVIIIGAREKIDRNVLDKVANTPKIIGSLSVGLDHLDLSALNEHRITVLNAPNANVISVAEHTIGMMLSLTKQLKRSDKSSQLDLGRAGVEVKPIELFGKTLGLIGFGKIGKAVAERAKCFGMSVIATSRTRSSGESDLAEFMAIEKLMRVSDVISVHVPLNSSTKNLINKNLLLNAKPGAFLVNTSRSEVVNHTDIQESLETRRLFGYAEDSDVMPDSLKGQDNIIWSPHFAGMTNEASDRLDNELIDNIEEFCKTQ